MTQVMQFQVGLAIYAVWKGIEYWWARTRPVQPSKWEDERHTLLALSDRRSSDEDWCRRNGVRYDPHNEFAYVDDIVAELLEK